MKVCIITFSPSGHTMTVGRKMMDMMEEAGLKVQLLDLTRKECISSESKIAEYLEEQIEPHDVICIGSPVYAGHFESNGKRIIKSLPMPNDKWGSYVIPFITYGGLHSSIALREAGNLLHKRGRINIMGMKIGAFHTLSATFTSQVNKDRPNQDDYQVVHQLVDRLLEFSDSSKKVFDIRKTFSYKGIIERFIFTVLNQDFFHKKYRNTSIHADNCIGCRACVNQCPMNIIEMINEKAVIVNPEACILCSECYLKCSQKAISYSYIKVVEARISKEHSLEVPQSMLYPITS